MENWGLITYRETALLLPAAGASMRSLRSVASTIAHEMSHLVCSCCLSFFPRTPPDDQLCFAHLSHPPRACCVSLPAMPDIIEHTAHPPQLRFHAKHGLHLQTITANSHCRHTVQS